MGDTPQEKPLTPEELLEAVKSDPKVREAIHKNWQLVMDDLSGKDADLTKFKGDEREARIYKQIMGLREVVAALTKEVTMIAVSGPGDPLDRHTDGKGPGEDFYRSLLANPATRRILREHVGEMIWIDVESQQWVIGDGLAGADELNKRVIAEKGTCDESQFYSRLIGDIMHAGHAFEP